MHIKDNIWTPFNKSYSCCILVNIIVERVVAPKSDQRAQAQTIREEDLSGCIKPHLREKTRHGRNSPNYTPVNTRLLPYDNYKALYLWFFQLAELRRDIEQNALFRSRQRHSTDEQDKQHEVWVCCWEIYHLKDISTALRKNKTKKHVCFDIMRHCAVILSEEKQQLGSSLKAWQTFII